MSIKEIRLFGDPVLTTPTETVKVFDRELRRLVRDLHETMVNADGAGLAAPQIGVGLRVFVWQVGEESGHLINPTLDLGEELQDGNEGCLSIPDLRFPTQRAMQVLAKGFNEYGEPIEVLGSEKLARAIQHESDHLDGILFIDRLPREERKLALKQIRDSEWFNKTLENQGKPVIRFSPHG